MIDHSGCDHPSTSSARARCRRAQANGEEGSAPRKKMGSTPREAPDRDNYGQTPGRREDECHICHVERIEFFGKDAWSGRTLLVGEKCAWRVKRSPEFRAFVR